MSRTIGIFLGAVLASAITATLVAKMAAGAAGSDLAARMQKMETELSRQKDIEAIRSLQYAYNYYNSGRLYKQVLDLVSENAGDMEIAGRGVYRGKEGFALNFHPDEDGNVTDKGVEFGFILHQLAGMDVITVAEDGLSAQARVRVLTVVYADFPDTTQRMNGGDYEIRYVKEGDKWLIHSMHYVHNFSVLHEKDGSIVPRYSTGPDGKADAPTTWYHPYPETGVLSFHFPNPVTQEFPPDVTGSTRYWIGNWPGEYGKTGHREPGNTPDE